MPQTYARTTTPPVMDEPSDIQQLIGAFEFLLQQTNAPDRLIVEAEKRRLIHAFETMVHQDIQRHPQPLPHENALFYEAVKQYGRDMLYYFLLLVGLIQNAATSYVFWSEFFVLIPAISNPTMVVFLSVFNTLFAGFLFYSFEVTFLHEALGMPNTNTAFSQLLALYSEQLNTSRAVLQILTSFHMLSVRLAQYDGYIQLMTLICQDFRIKHEAMGCYPESFWESLLKVIALAFGAFSSIAGSYVAVNALLTTLAASWVGTPLGWGLMMIAIVVDLGFYYAMGATSTARLINPAFDNYHDLKKELGLFHSTPLNDLRTIRSMKTRFFEQKSSQDACTQTDETLSNTGSF